MIQLITIIIHHYSEKGKLGCPHGLFLEVPNFFPSGSDCNHFQLSFCPFSILCLSRACLATFASVYMHSSYNIHLFPSTCTRHQKQNDKSTLKNISRQNKKCHQDEQRLPISLCSLCCVFAPMGILPTRREQRLCISPKGNFPRNKIII